MTDDPTTDRIDMASAAGARLKPRPPLSAQEVDPTKLPFGLRSNSFCTIAWMVEPFEAIMVFADPALADRAQEICEAMNTLTTTHRDIDGLSEAIRRWADGAGLSAAIYDEPQEDLSQGVMAVSFEIG